MKKITLLLIGIQLACFNVSAQCDNDLPITEQFDNSTVVDVCWNLVDQDGDGYDWYWREYASFYGGHKCLTSRSWNSSDLALNPDNWIYSYAIDLTGFNTSNNIELSWKVRGELASLSHEFYTVYAATNNEISDFLASPIQRGEYVDEVGGAGNFVTRTLDISSLAGNTVYIAFRHHNSSDQLIINIDDVSISSSTLGTDDFISSNFNYFYNKNLDILTLKSPNTPINSVKIYNIMGQQVTKLRLSQVKEDIYLSNIKDGIYIAKVEIDNTFQTIKFIKQ